MYHVGRSCMAPSQHQDTCTRVIMPPQFLTVSLPPKQREEHPTRSSKSLLAVRFIRYRWPTPADCKMQLFIRSDAGRTLTVAIANPRAKVQELLTLVEAKQQGLFTQGYLNYGGVPLRASRSLTDYGIQNHATLDLSRRLHGGCFGFSILLWILIFICCLISVCTCGLSLPVALCLLPPALLLPLCCL
ncbi:hypothetical protein F442_16034 [Phytophthora nicotianae P10297]|uniref:Ubiquitin-like domain-containing protein n=5 Tax=Phytophthora nicotianae TaxID=4792 RepID=W2PRA3_PHYN3|nr:hypothetical protein PPTG_15730 [Phytophthora nicotianae INRA-310]ETI38000.1 hypothetical protein F443_16182 [Phytophthora nicotianae P1569]ETK78196.1 hypothetical protein L915_15739 [Phytophthora nicotianae]ETO66756.1 hypothetical protein F444_16166 [Phytophthora nicotianae P1976]ETP35918.1 hypothetical protein F442_16034 [Phytophthora nicotianae P10297]ETL84857.1 hypothetical protein L917_15451 [Phytophthora nicotianae]